MYWVDGKDETFLEKKKKSIILFDLSWECVCQVTHFLHHSVRVCEMAVKVL